MKACGSFVGDAPTRAAVAPIQSDDPGWLHCEALLLEDGSRQEDVWGADWVPLSQEVRFEALINIRPQQNPSMTILDPSIRERVEEVVRRLLGGV